MSVCECVYMFTSWGAGGLHSVALVWRCIGAGLSEEK